MLIQVVTVSFPIGGNFLIASIQLTSMKLKKNGGGRGSLLQVIKLLESVLFCFVSFL